MAGPGSGAAAAFGPSHALARAPGPRLDAAWARLERVQRELDAARAGLDAALVAVPTLAYGADVEDPPEVTASLALEVDVAYRHDPVAILAAQGSVAGAERQVLDAMRWEGKEALEWYGGLLRAQIALDVARTAADATASRLADAASGGDATAIAYAEAEARDDALDLARARVAVDRLAARAAEMGVEGSPDFVPVAFALPRVPPEETPTYRILSIEAARATGALERERRFGRVPSVSVDARYESKTHSYQLDASVALDQGRPMAALGGQLRSQQDDQWSVTVSARVRIDEGTADGLWKLRTAADDARRDLEQYVDEYAARVDEALQNARWAREEVALALAVQATREAEVEHLRLRRQTLRAALESAGGAAEQRELGSPERERVERELRAVERELRTVERDLQRAEARLPRDADTAILRWLQYVEEVDDYLEIVGAPWVVESEIDAAFRPAESAPAAP